MSSVGRQHLFIVPGRLQVYAEIESSVFSTFLVNVLLNNKNIIIRTMTRIIGMIVVLDIPFLKNIKKKIKN